MSTSWNGYQGYTSNGHPSLNNPSKKPMYRASTAPVAGFSAHPAALMPGHAPQRIDRSDLYFTNASRMRIAHDVRHSTPPALPPSPYHYNTQASAPPVPPLPPMHTHPGRFQRSLSSPPPVPPKPNSHHPPSLVPTHPLGIQIPMNKTPPEPIDEDDLAVALALSQSVSHQEQKLRDKISDQEEQDLARALEASLSSSRSGTYPIQEDVMEGSSSVPLDIFRPSTSIADDEAFAKNLAMKEDISSEPNVISTELKTPDSELPSYLLRNDDDKARIPSPATSDDEKLARKLALEDTGREGDTHQLTNSPRSELPPSLPEYLPSNSAHSKTVRTELIAATHSAGGSQPNGVPKYGEPIRHVAPALQSKAVRDTPPESPTQNLPAYAETAPSSSVSDSPPGPPGVRVWSMPPVLPEAGQSSLIRPSPSMSNMRTANIPTRSDQGLLRLSNNIGRASSMSSLAESYADDPQPSEDNNSESSSITGPSLLNINHFVDKQLFVGVSIGFMGPKITPELVPMQEVMPNIISLPYGRCPPLHLQGPNWRHLLKLMARLSGTRLEPTVEALAISKLDLRLRTVVQFVRPHASSPDWRTILYFTIDHPPPQNTLTKSGVNDLPYSYSLSSIPTLLRDAADTPVSKIYTIPASDSVPYPTLPITFPNLAMYLQAALEESRRYVNDSSSGYRKLAKMIQTCYKTEEPVQEEPERNSVGGLFKRVMGRNNRSSRRGGGNEDTYEFVTPFVPGEWG